MTSPVLKNYRGYLGNDNIKRAGVKIEWTPEQRLEVLKCKRDPVYFAETYMRIVNADGELIPFELYDYQKDIIRSLHENRRLILLQARQSGKTTTIASYILWYVIFNATKNVAILANTGDTAQEILKKIQDFYEYIPKWLQQGVIEWNKRSVEFENKSRILTGACTKSSIRGKTIQFMLIDETAFVENWEEFYISTFNTMANSKKSKIALVSTPNGANHFADFWEGANEKDPKKNNGWVPRKVRWADVPGRDEAWKQEILKGTNFDYEMFAQEHECEFLGTSGTLIAGWRLKDLINEREIPVEFGHGMYQFTRPIKDHRYCIVCDVSRGRGLDYSTMQIIDVTEMPYRQVCVFRDNMITPLDFAEKIFRSTKSYNEASVLVEINDIGEQVSQALFYDFEYENVLMTENNGRSGKRISAGFGSKEKDFGIRTTKTVKAIGCSMAKLLIEQKKLILVDKQTIDEFKTFSKKGQSYEAESGKHDDLVMPIVLFGWLTDQQFFKEFTDINTLQVLREKSEEQMMEEMLPFGFVDDGSDEIPLEEPKVVPSMDRWLLS